MSNTSTLPKLQEESLRAAIAFWKQRSEALEAMCRHGILLYRVGDELSQELKDAQVETIFNKELQQQLKGAPK
jgi:hypothetical protein